MRYIYVVGLMVMSLWLLQEFIIITSEPYVHICDGGMEEDINGYSRKS